MRRIRVWKRLPVYELKQNICKIFCMCKNKVEHELDILLHSEMTSNNSWNEYFLLVFRCLKEMVTEFNFFSRFNTNALSDLWMLIYFRTNVCRKCYKVWSFTNVFKSFTKISFLIVRKIYSSFLRAILWQTPNIFDNKRLLCKCYTQ